MKSVLRRVSDFRLITLAVASALAIAAVNADARTGDSQVKAQKSGTTSVQRSRGADGAVDKIIVGPNGGITSVDRSRGADGAIDSLATGPRGGTTIVDRSLNADGTVNRTVTRAPAP